MKQTKTSFSIPELYRISVKAFRSAGDLVRSRRSGLLPDSLRERIMLAVTAVNSCPMCSYAHTEMALRAGLSAQEIRELLQGEFPELPEYDAAAVLFAQHYADRRGRPSRGAWRSLVSRYGLEKARAILAACRVIMLGNSVGIVFSSIRGRHGQAGPDPRCSSLYEMSVVYCLVPMLAAAMLRAGADTLLRPGKR